MQSRVLIIVGDGGESYETLYASHRLKEEGYLPVLAAPSKRSLHLVIHDFEPGWDTYVERIGYRMDADIALSEADHRNYLAVILIGGRSPEYLRNDPKVQSLVRAFDSAGKGVFALCHGIQIVTASGLAKGRRLTCYGHIQWEVEISGGKFEDRECVRDGNLITARTWQDHPGFYREVMAWLRDHARSEYQK
jgi:protease I